jgi:hypothetical protein
MLDEPPKPKRKIRRWIVAGVLLSVLVAAGLWYWPRGDRRFVGTWEVSGRIWEFTANGLVIARGGAGDSSVRHYSTWNVENDVLTIGRPGNVWPTWQRRLFDLWNSTFPLHQWLFGGIELQATDVRSDRLECVPKATAPEQRREYSWIMTRIPE